MDVLYYIGSGSHHQNQELLYSLRALEMHCKDLGDVWIVGNRPHFLNDKVRYLWVEDSGEWWQNAFNKTMAAINAGIGPNFLLMNDDFVMLKDFTAARYPHYFRGEISTVAKNKYQQVIVNTRRVLEDLGATTQHYGVHCPMRINADKYKTLIRFYQDENNPVSARCLYGNLFCKGTRVGDCKNSVPQNSKTKCWSAKDWISKEVFDELEKMFPQKSRWEV